jgi:hypothetical protein
MDLVSTVEKLVVVLGLSPAPPIFNQDEETQSSLCGFRNHTVRRTGGIQRRKLRQGELARLQ